VGLFGALSGEQLTRLAEATERLELPPGAAFGSTEATVDLLLTGLARGSGGMLRPGDVADGPASSVTACVVARCDRDAIDALLET
jgi:hypothetical protein